MHEIVTVQIKDGIADVRLNRPDQMNALTPEVLHALVEVGKELAGDRSDVGAVVLSGEGRAFSAGLDFGQFEQMTEQGASDLLIKGDVLGDAEALGQQAVHVWSLVPAPVIAAVHGVALGGGLQIALGADIRIAEPTARLSVTEVLWGLVPDMMGTQLLPGLVGRDVALELSLTGRMFSGTEAERLGVVTRLDPDPLQAALALAAEVAGMSRSATRGIKRLIGLAGHVPLREGLRAEQDVIIDLMGSAEQIEAVDRRMSVLAQAKREKKVTPPGR